MKNWIALFTTEKGELLPLIVHTVKGRVSFTVRNQLKEKYDGFLNLICCGELTTELKHIKFTILSANVYLIDKDGKFRS